MRYDPIPADLFIANRLRLAKLMKTASVAILVSNDAMPRNGDQYFPYRQNSDLFYLCGIEQPGTVLVLAPTHPDIAMREVVFILPSDPTQEQWNGHRLSAEEASDVSGVNTVRTTDELDTVLRDLLIWSRRIYLAVNEYPRFYPEIETRDRRFARWCNANYPLQRIDRLAPLMTALRVEKQPLETALLSKACEITGNAFESVLKTVAPGMKEYEIEALMTWRFLQQGASGHAYSPIVASGKNACILHYTDNNRVMQEGDLLLMDFGAEYANYAADCSRTIPVGGAFSPRQRACYEAVLRVFEKAKDLYFPGNSIHKVNQAVWKMMEAEMIGLGLFTAEDVENQNPATPCYARYLMHGVCHPVGLDVHDVGGKNEPFPIGQVLTLEPGLYLPEEGFGIRIENDIVVGEPPVDLMAHIPVTPDEIERIMRNKNNDL